MEVYPRSLQPGDELLETIIDNGRTVEKGGHVLRVIETPYRTLVEVGLVGDTILLEWPSGSKATITVHRHPVEDQHHQVEGILTTGQLRKWLEGVADDVQVVLDDRDGWYDNVERVIVPAGDFGGEFSAVTLCPGHSVDSRQF